MVERWLARLGGSPYAEQFVLKGGMLLAAYDARRPTADVDALARGVVNDQDAVVGRISEVTDQSIEDDGVEFLTDTPVARPIREDAFYPGVRVAMDARVATALVRFRLDVNFGDPVTPAPRMIELPSLRAGNAAPVRVLGYPIETMLGGEAGDGDHARRGEHPRPRLRRRLHVDRTPRPDAWRGARCAGRDNPVPRRADRAAVIGRGRPQPAA